MGNSDGVSVWRGHLLARSRTISCRPNRPAENRPGAAGLSRFSEGIDRLSSGAMLVVRRVWIGATLGPIREELDG
jgi:hypothetical protein